MRAGQHNKAAHLARDDGLHEEAQHGEHGQAAVLDLLHLELGQGVRVGGKLQRVKGTACMQQQASRCRGTSDGPGAGSHKHCAVLCQCCLPVHVCRGAPGYSLSRPSTPGADPLKR